MFHARKYTHKEKKSMTFHSLCTLTASFFHFFLCFFSCFFCRLPINTIETKNKKHQKKHQQITGFGFFFYFLDFSNALGPCFFDFFRAFSGAFSRACSGAFLVFFSGVFCGSFVLFLGDLLVLLLVPFSDVFCVVCYFLYGLPKIFGRVDLLSLSLRQSRRFVR